jgi:hypothetical protein
MVYNHEMKKLLFNLLKSFDNELLAKVALARKDDAEYSTHQLELRIVGQVALILSDLPFPVASTNDIDILHQLPYPEFSTLRTRCLDIGLVLETDQHLIWMPENTVYQPLFQGIHVRASVAEPLYVLASKCKFQRQRDKDVLQKFFLTAPAAEDQVKAMGIDTTWVAS